MGGLVQILQMAAVGDERCARRGALGIAEQTVRFAGVAFAVHIGVLAFHGKRDGNVCAARKLMVGLIIEARLFAFQAIHNPRIVPSFAVQLAKLAVFYNLYIFVPAVRNLDIERQLIGIGVVAVERCRQLLAVIDGDVRL